MLQACRRVLAHKCQGEDACDSDSESETETASTTTSAVGKPVPLAKRTKTGPQLLEDKLNYFRCACVHLYRCLFACMQK